MERVGEVDLGPWGQLTTGGDVSGDGSVVALRTYHQIVMWPRPPGTNLAEAFDNEPCEAPTAAERQGESLTFAADDDSYLTISEGRHPPINRFTVK